MIYLFSSQAGPLREGAEFMRTKKADRHPGDAAFYLAPEHGRHHDCLGDLGPGSTFEHVNCALVVGEAAIIIGHGGDDNRLYDEAQQDVTAAALRLMQKIASDNPAGRYTFFLAACGGAVRQPGRQASLLFTMVNSTPAMAEQLRQETIECWGYTASAGLVVLGPGLPPELGGTHIYGTLYNALGVDEHCGYDCRITTRLRRLWNGKYVTVFFAPALYPLSEIVNWANGGYTPDMQVRFPDLYPTVERVHLL